MFRGGVEARTLVLGDAKPELESAAGRGIESVVLGQGGEVCRRQLCIGAQRVGGRVSLRTVDRTSPDV